jgi:Dolichyl-phosphate-mannose-protein mannosyltransferase
MIGAASVPTNRATTTWRGRCWTDAALAGRDAFRVTRCGFAGLHWITGYSYAREIYIQCLVGALAVLLTFVLGQQLAGARTGLLAALGAAIDIVLINQSVRFLSEILFTPVVLAVAISFTGALERPSVGRFTRVGFWIGIANLIRPTLVAFPFVAAAVTVLTWMVHNYVRDRAVYPLATSNAILWQGSPEYYHLIRNHGYTYLEVWNKVIYGPGNEGHDPGSIEGDRYWTARALRSIVSEPVLYIRFCAEKAITYWIGDPNADWADARIFDFRALRRKLEMSRSTAAQYMVWRAFPILAFAGLFVLRRRLLGFRGVLSILAYCTLLHALTHAEVRLSEPLHPLLLVIAAAAARHMLTSWRIQRA